jgi:hypothetical protein
MGKKIFAVTLILLVGFTPATAAPKSISLKSIPLIADSLAAEALVFSGKTIVTYENIQGSSLDVLVTGRDITGNILWSRTIGSNQDEIATAMAIDSKGDIWLAGSSNLPPAITSTESTTAIQSPINPDLVDLEDVAPIRTDMNVLNLWHVTALGETKTPFSLTLESPVLVNAISVTTTGISVITMGETGPILFNANLQGNFKKPTAIGSTKTELTSLVRNDDGSLHLFGSSSENLYGKSLAGKRDGILMKTNSAGRVLSVVRSSISNGMRAWSSSTPSNFLTGSVTTSSTSEIAITKFSSKFIPTWTTRISGSGKSLGVNGARGSFFVALAPRTLKGVTRWVPAKGQNALLIFNSQGILTAAYSSPNLGSVISASFSKDSGIVLLAEKRGSTENSIYYLNSR